jgi:hypothetical protein
MDVKEVRGVRVAARNGPGDYKIVLDHTPSGKIGLSVPADVLLTVTEARHLANDLVGMADKVENENA